MALQRRNLLAVISASMTGLVGCSSNTNSESATTPTESPTPSDSPDKPPFNEPTQTPTERERVIKFIASNGTDSRQTVSVTITIDGDTVLTNSLQMAAEANTPIGTFEEAGEYRVTVEMEEDSQSETAQIQESYLRDCNQTTGRIRVTKDGIRIHFDRTQKGCT